MSTESLISVVRWVLLVGIVTNVLQATVLFEWFQRAIVGRWAAMAERMGRPLPPLLLNRRLQRAFLILNVIVFLVVWWFLGTPTGVAFFFPRSVG